jgi:hypothetical protein
VIAKEMAPFRLLGNEILEPGGVYYVGDFVATSRHATRFKILFTEHHFSWRITSREDNYLETTQAMKRVYTNLATATTANRMPHRRVGKAQQSNTEAEPLRVDAETTLKPDLSVP